MFKLSEMKNTSITRKARKLLGRGIGSGMGKTCGRGEKGAGSRSGYTRRLGYEGGQFRTYMKMPIRGFSNAKFRKQYFSINLGQLDKIFEDGDTINEFSLRHKGIITGKIYGLKILGNGQLLKKVEIEADAFSASAINKLNQEKITFSIKE